MLPEFIKLSKPSQNARKQYDFDGIQATANKLLKRNQKSIQKFKKKSKINQM